MTRSILAGVAAHKAAAYGFAAKFGNFSIHPLFSVGYTRQQISQQSTISHPSRGFHHFKCAGDRRIDAVFDIGLLVE